MVRFWRNLIFTISILQTKNAPNFIEIGQFQGYFKGIVHINKKSDFDKIWCVFGLESADCKNKFWSKSDHFLVLFWPWIANETYSHPKILIFFFTHWNMKMGQVWKKSEITIMELILLCRLKSRVWPHAHMGELRPKILCTFYYLPKRSHGVKFKQNPRNCPSGCS